MSTAPSRNGPAPTRRVRGRRMTFWATILGLVLLTLVVPYMLFVQAPPPRTIVMATGSEEGVYYKFGLRYAELLEKEGLTLKVIPTKGSKENLELLQKDDSGISVAIVQSGVAEPEAGNKLNALGSLYREPFWVFYRSEKPLERLTELAGKRIAVGPRGSGTRAVALKLLAANGLATLDKGDVASAKVELADETGSVAAKWLLEGKHPEAKSPAELDAAIFVAAIDPGGYIDMLAKSKSDRVRLMNFPQHEAYQRRFRFLSSVSVPAGLVDLGKNIPDKELHLVAPTAMLVVRQDLHPALESLLLTVAGKVHGKEDLFAKTGEFPSASFVDLPLSEDAERFYKSGPPVLQRLLPFWLASLVDRLKIMLIPLVMLLMPLFRAAPPLVQWRTRRKIYRWYETLRTIDQKLMTNPTGPELEEELAKLRTLEYKINHVEVPLSYMKELYHLRLHLKMVHEKLERMMAELGEVY